ncbi:MAG: phosphoglucosamine mutase [Thermoleophilia bacterium]|nr:phosphoglucosamine mutase [Thermoleophilia bacterium]
MRRYFGTDGVRGVYGQNLTDLLVERLGSAFARWCEGAPVLVGRDTRASGAVLERALAGGLAAGGSDVVLGGVLPSPAVALLAEGAGAVVSASHNPAAYNGVKFFAAGTKLTDGEEEQVEALLDRAAVTRCGATRSAEGLRARYADAIAERFGSPLDGLRVGVDCANGALAGIAPGVLRRLGAEVVAVADSPDGSNINEACGATDLALLSGRVREHGLDLGVAFDGDGDRMLAVDASGAEVDGDQILAVLALHRGVALVAVTVMTNLGFHRLMAERGVRVVTTDVGDRYVLEALRREGGVLGGEQSGHLICLDGHVTGDGLAAALMLCSTLVGAGQSLAEAVSVMPRLPQEKRNVAVRSRLLTPELVARVAEVNASLEGRARVLVRPSGTEPLVRVLAEAEAASEAENLCARMASLVEQELG